MDVTGTCPADCRMHGRDLGVSLLTVALEGSVSPKEVLSMDEEKQILAPGKGQSF